LRARASETPLTPNFVAKVAAKLVRLAVDHVVDDHTVERGSVSRESELKNEGDLLARLDPCPVEQDMSSVRRWKQRIVKSRSRHQPDQIPAVSFRAVTVEIDELDAVRMLQLHLDDVSRLAANISQHGGTLDKEVTGFDRSAREDTGIVRPRAKGTIALHALPTTPDGENGNSECARQRPEASWALHRRSRSIRTIAAPP